MESRRKFFKAFSNPTRMAIIEELRKGRKCVKELAEALGKEQSRVSHNLKCLLNCGFVEVEKVGRNRYYSLDKEHITLILEHIDAHIEAYEERMRKCRQL